MQLAPWASRRRRDLVELLERLNPTIVELSQAIEQEAEQCREGQRLLTHPSRCRSTHGPRLLADHRESRALSVWEANCELSRTGGSGAVQRGSATVGAYHQTREFDAGFLTGRSRAGYGPQHPGMAEQVCPPDDAARRQDRQGGDGTTT